MKRLARVWMVLVLAVASSAGAQDAPPANPLAEKAAAILQRNCLLCHNGPGSVSKAAFDVRSVESMNESDVIRGGKPEESQLWVMAHRGTMPPRSQPQLARLIGEDSQILAEWIKAGAAPFKKPEARPHVTLESTLKAIVADLGKLPDTRTRARQRYFSLAEAYNNPAISEDSLLLSRAALAKTVNSLSWNPDIVAPRAINESQTLFQCNPHRSGQLWG